MVASKSRNSWDLIAVVFCTCFILYFFFHTTSLQWKVERPSSFLVEAYKAQAASRQSFLDKIKTSNDFLGYGYLFNNLAPEVYCPEKVKVGTTDDGGKWMCAPENLPKGCVILALGINGVITFEENLQGMSEKRCRLISVDMNGQPEGVIKALDKIRGTVVQAKIAARDNATQNLRTMASILREQGVGSDLEVLKMDIEGAEFAVMESFLEEYTPAQIMIEIHGNPRQNLQLLKTFASKGYLLLNYEINGRARTLCEYAFIHQNRLERYGATILARYL